MGKSHARNPTKKTHHPKPTQTKPNHHIHRLSSAPHARGGPYVARVTCGTLVASHRKMRPHARHEARAPRRTYEHGAKRSRAHGNSNSSGMSSGAAAAAGSAPERPSLTGGVPSVSNAGVVGGIVHLAAVLRVARRRPHTLKLVRLPRRTCARKKDSIQQNLGAWGCRIK